MGARWMYDRSMSVINNRKEALDYIRLTVSLIKSDYKMGDDLLLDNLVEVAQWLEEEIASLQTLEQIPHRGGKK